MRAEAKKEVKTEKCIFCDGRVPEHELFCPVCMKLQVPVQPKVLQSWRKQNESYQFQKNAVEKHGLMALEEYQKAAKQISNPVKTAVVLGVVVSAFAGW